MKTLFTLFFIASLALGQGSGTALEFDGNDYVLIPHTPILNPSTQITVEAWIIPNEATANRKIVSKFGDISLNDAYDFGVISNRLFFVIRQPSTVTPWQGAISAQLLTLGEITHVAGTYDGDTAKVYVNGQPTAVYLPGTIPFSPSNLRIGSAGSAVPSSIGRFRGTIDEVRIWNRALTQDEIRHKMCETLTGTEPGLVAYYRMDEGTDGTCGGGEDVCDASGNGNHGTKF